MIFVGFVIILLNLLANDGWPGMLLGGGLMVVGAFSYLDGVL